MNEPLVSLIIVARNAEKYLPDLLADLLAQDYDHQKIELLGVDSCSSDGTEALFKRFQEEHPEFSVKVLANPKKILAAGWNVALADARGDLIIRVDAHARIPQDFIRMNVEVAGKGHDIVGGQRISVIPEDKMEALFALAESSKFGAGSAGFKNPGPARFVDTLAHAAYRREVFLKAGGYDERLVRTEDNEIHQRMKAAGFKFYFDPLIKSYHYPRPSFKGLLHQKFCNGFGVGVTMSVAPSCFGLRHFVPFLFLVTLALFIVCGVASNWLPLLALLVLYWSVAVFFAFRSSRESDRPLGLMYGALPDLFLLIHLAYGLGTLLGLLSVPAFLANWGDYKVPQPVRRIDLCA
ncbi:MAG: glycosyltransferase family 2 protein [Candidatus Omnitrophica bacterium]|nr:glycosyltransferase family 2 protein [Candidatus Omnitrophota bacterium]